MLKKVSLKILKFKTSFQKFFKTKKVTTQLKLLVKKVNLKKQLDRDEIKKTMSLNI